MGAGVGKSLISTSDQQHDVQGNSNGTAARSKRTGNISMALIPKMKVAASKFVKAKRQTKEQARRELLWEYPEIKDILMRVGDIMREMDHLKDADFSRKTMNVVVKELLEELQELHFNLDKEEEYKKVIGDELARNNAGYIFTEYIKVLTSDGTETPTGRDDYNAECLKLLRINCLNYSDASLDLCVHLGKMGLINLLMNDMVKFKDTYEQDEVQSIVSLAMPTLYHCALATENGKYFKEAKAVEALLPYAKSANRDAGSQLLKLVAIITLAYVVDEQDGKLFSVDGSLLEHVLACLRDATAAKDHTCNGFSAREIVAGIMHLANNGDSSLAIVKAGILPILVKLMKQGSNSEKEIAAKTVWVLAFNNENKKKILEEEGMEEVLENINKYSDHRPTIRAASGALWVLGVAERIGELKNDLQPRRKRANRRQRGRTDSGSEKIPYPMSMPARLLREEGDRDHIVSRKPRPSPPGRRNSAKREGAVSRASSQSDYADDDAKAFLKNMFSSEDDTQEIDESDSGPRHVMISYQWDCQRLMIRLRDKLEEAGYRMWIDDEFMSGSTLQTMAEAVENAEVFLMCMSQKYKQSISCRTEAEYAYKKGKTIISLRIEQSYEPDGWLGAILGAKLYFDFSNYIAFDGATSKLMKELRDKGKSTDAIENPFRLTPRTRPKRAKRIHPNEWSESNVATWAENNGITSKKVLELDGSSLIFLSDLRQEAPEFFYKYLAEKLGVAELKDIMKVNDGLENLTLRRPSAWLF